ncbi:MAG TPA: CPBP family intramembrane glutamic endopeptidase [Polyangia bacterium]|jgi:hypothetical protein|nr:CPBP family intramembrane glutamic endopeptidase [Polyangia bacterium]
MRLAGAAALLFLFYQLPEGLGLRLLHAPVIAAALMTFFHVVAYVVGRVLGYRGFDAYAMELREGWARNLAVPFLLAVAAKGAALIVGALLGVYTIESGGTAPAIGALVLTMLGTLAVTLVPSAAEDIVTRGFWFRAVPRRWTPVGFVVFSSVIYVLNHVYRLTHGPTEWLMLLCFGLAYATALVRTGSLWAAIGLHWGWNFSGLLVDAFWSTTVHSDWQSRGLSSGAHLLLLLAVLIPRRHARQTPQ